MNVIRKIEAKRKVESQVVQEVGGEAEGDFITRTISHERHVSVGIRSISLGFLRYIPNKTEFGVGFLFHLL